MIYEFQATQSYNGYDKPWAPGTGINLWDDSSIELGKWCNNSGVISDNITGGISTIKIPNTAGTYCGKSFGTRPYSWSFLEYAEDDSFIKRDHSSNGANQTYTLDENCAYFIVQISKEADGTSLTIDDVKLFMFVCSATTSPDAYTPYANVCMPEGFNIWDPTNQEYVQVYAGYVNANTRELYLRPVYKEYAGEELVGPWMSSLDPYAEDATPTEGAFVIDFGGELTSYEITPFMLQTLLESLGIRQHFTDGAGLLNSLMDQAQGRVRSEEELLHLSRPLKVIAIGDQLPSGITFKPISKDVLPGLPGKFIR